MRPDLEMESEIAPMSLCAPHWQCTLVHRLKNPLPERLGEYVIESERLEEDDHPDKLPTGAELHNSDSPKYSTTPPTDPLQAVSANTGYNFRYSSARTEPPLCSLPTGLFLPSPCHLALSKKGTAEDNEHWKAARRRNAARQARFLKGEEEYRKAVRRRNAARRARFMNGEEGRIEVEVARPPQAMMRWCIENRADPGSELTEQIGTTSTTNTNTTDGTTTTANTEANDNIDDNDTPPTYPNLETDNWASLVSSAKHDDPHGVLRNCWMKMYLEWVEYVAEMRKQQELWFEKWYLREKDDWMSEAGLISQRGGIDVIRDGIDARQGV